MSVLILFSLIGLKRTNAESDSIVCPTPSQQLTGNFPNKNGHLILKIETLESGSYQFPGTDKSITVTFRNSNS